VPNTVYIVSDALGETAEQVARGAAIQFDGGVEAIEWVRRAHIADGEAVRRAVAEAASRRPCLIVYTLVKPELRHYLDVLAEEAGIPHVDVLGPVLDAMTTLFGRPPRLVPGLSHRLTRDYFARVDALEFAVRYDDGKDPAGALLADIVILGVSRTSKTPVSLYLANHRLKVANFPLVPESPVPPEIRGPARKKCVGLVVDPETLRQIRTERLKALGLPPNAPYASRARILAELDYAWAVYNDLGCPVIDVTNHAVEETATKILEITGQPSSVGSAGD
jgi:regulator of PEP synthase PpsR (kinase-PPPase family)